MKFKKNKLIIEVCEVEFQYDILDVKYCNELYIVMLKIPNSVEETDNVYGIRDDGTVEWRIENPVNAFEISNDVKGYAYYEQSIYVGFLDSDEGFLHVVTFSGMKYKLDCRNGNLVKIESSRW